MKGRREETNSVFAWFGFLIVNNQKLEDRTAKNRDSLEINHGEDCKSWIYCQLVGGGYNDGVLQLYASAYNVKDTCGV